MLKLGPIFVGQSQSDVVALLGPGSAALDAAKNPARVYRWKRLALSVVFRHDSVSEIVFDRELPSDEASVNEPVGAGRIFPTGGKKSFDDAPAAKAPVTVAAFFWMGQDPNHEYVPPPAAAGWTGPTASEMDSGTNTYRSQDGAGLVTLHQDHNTYRNFDYSFIILQDVGGS